jgi:hypothetical protein
MPESLAQCDYSTWLYDGMEIRTVTVISASDDQDAQPLQIQSVEISADKYRLAHGLRVGLPRVLFIERLGKPENEYDDMMIYGSEDPLYEIDVHLGPVNTIHTAALLCQKRPGKARGEKFGDAK